MLFLLFILSVYIYTKYGSTEDTDIEVKDDYFSLTLQNMQTPDLAVHLACNNNFLCAFSHYSIFLLHQHTALY